MAEFKPVDISTAQNFLTRDHWGVLASRRKDGGLQMSPMTVALDSEGRAIISSRETAYKVNNRRRDPRAAACTFTPNFRGGGWVQVNGRAEIISLAAALDSHIFLQRQVYGEHKSGPEFRERVVPEKRAIIRIGSKAWVRKRLGECRETNIMRRELTNERFTRLRLRIAPIALALWVGAFVAPSVSHSVAQERSLAGQLLVATPDMRDPRFVETVIYMVKHGAEGAMGIVINRPISKVPLEELLKGFRVESKGAKGEIVLHYGGPVSPDTGFILHSDDVLLESSTRVKDGIAMTSDPKLIEALARGQSPRQSLFAFGYAGWAPGQLETELKADAWFIVSADKALIFGKDAEKKWRQAIDKRQIPL